MSLKPTAQGNLQKTPFPHLVLYMHGRKLTGTLAIWPESTAVEERGQDRVYFRDGAVVAVRPRSAGLDGLGALRELFARRDGAYGFYADQDLLGAGENTLPVRVDSFTLVASGLKAHPRAEVVDAVLTPLGTRPLRMRAGVALDKLELSRDERTLVDVLRAGPATLEELLRASVLPADEVRRLLCTLTMVRGVEAHEDSATMAPPPAASRASLPPGRASVMPAPMTPGTSAIEKLPTETISSRISAVPVPRRPSATTLQALLRVSMPPSSAARERTTREDSPSGEQHLPAPAMPQGLSMEDKARWLELSAAYDHMDARTHFELLGITDAATEREVQHAYFGLVKRFHPDRLSPALAPLVPCAQLFFERLTEASETLCNAEQRALYAKSVQDGGGTRASERMMRDVIESAMEYQKAEILLKRRDFPGALALVQRALARSPDESDYNAMRGWLLHLMNPGESAPLEDMLRSFDRALKANERNERAHYYKGVVLKRLRRDTEALRHFKTAAELNPRNVDAAREVRIATLRRQSKAPPPPQGGILSKLFRGPSKEKG
jgi:curved DNA-binding protein CbpA